ncbi:MAG: sensor histidine kinase [Actinomycetota bacterium]
MPEEPGDTRRRGPPWRHGGSGGGPPWSYGGPPWRGGGGSGRPPWWPENEPWPPEGGAAWRRFRPPHVARRIGFAFALFFGLLFLTSALAVAVLSGLFGLRRHHGLVPLAAVLGLVLLLGLISLGRWLRRLAAPVGEVMAAADRVAGGDYSVRVEERGPREMRRLARSINSMTERLGSDEERRRALLADVTHELRTPLAVIQGNAEGLLDGLYPMDEQHLRPVLEETRIMARLLDDLQTLSTAEAGALRLQREPVTPGRLVEDAVGAFAAHAGERRVRLATSVPDGLPELSVDPLRIGEVLSNLLTNAVRHTPGGGTVTVSAERGGDGDRVAFAVSDTGPGIAPEHLPHVFDRYVKATGTGGSGLGLAIARSLVEAHGGEIAAESDPAVGTTIHFNLPVSPS